LAAASADVPTPLSGAAAAAPTPPSDASPPPAGDAGAAPPTTPRFLIRPARQSELLAVADVRASAFYAEPPDAHFYPARRRELLLTLSYRLRRAHNACYVIVDTAPDPAYAAALSFFLASASSRPPLDAPTGIVVGSVDAAVHDAETGGRLSLDSLLPGIVRLAKGGAGLRGAGAAAGAGGGDKRRAPARLDRERRVYLSSMAVRSEYRRMGLASALVRRVERMAAEAGVANVFLHVEATNKAAVALYRRAGYTEYTDAGGGVPAWMRSLAKASDVLLRKAVGGGVPSTGVGGAGAEAEDRPPRRGRAG